MCLTFTSDQTDHWFNTTHILLDSCLYSVVLKTMKLWVVVFLTLFKYSLFAAQNNPSPMDGERETDITPPNNRCSTSPSLSKISKVGKSILFGLLDHCRVHHSHPHCTGHSHVHPHPHHALIGDHSHPHAHSHSHHSPRVCHGVYRGSDCCRSKAHDRKSLGEKVARCLVSWK